MLPELPEGTLAERIRKARVLHGLSQSDLARKLEVAPGSVSTWESGKRRPSDEIKLRLADLFQVTLDWLMGRSTSKEAVA